MIQEAYISFEVAKLLKAKGFDEGCIKYYNSSGGGSLLVCSMILNYGITANNSKLWEVLKPHVSYAAPTQQMAMRWLREVHDIKIMIRPYVDGTYGYEILDGFWYVNFDSYEDAAEAAIKYCLENLVK